MLAGTPKNLPVIGFPFTNRVIVSLYRLMPGLMGRIINQQT